MPDPIEVRIEKLVYGGDGLGHHDGHTVFVPFVLPDETVSVDPLERQKEIHSRPRGADHASLSRIAWRRAARTSAPAADATTSTCRTSCRFARRRTFCARPFRVWAASPGTGPIVPHASPPFEYRNRAQWKIARSPRWRRPEIGYFEAGSQKLCAVRECPILSPLLSETLRRSVAAAGDGQAVAGSARSRSLRRCRRPEAASESSLRQTSRRARTDRRDAALPRFPQIETILFQDRARRSLRTRRAGPHLLSRRRSQLPRGTPLLFPGQPLSSPRTGRHA